MNVLALCAGIGGLELGLKQATANAARIVCFCEGEAYAVAVLRARMEDGSLDHCPIWSDVRSFDGRPWRGKVDCITAGWPCQPWSLAGKRQGAKDSRHLWPIIASIIRDVQPQWVFGENVPGHINAGLPDVLHDLEEMGYNSEAGLFSAIESGAPHIRQRLFLLAHADRQGQPQSQGSLKGERGRLGDGCQETKPWFAKRGMGGTTHGAAVGMDRPWSTDWESAISRTAETQPHRIDRLRCLGNAVVPATAALAWRTLCRKLAVNAH